MPESLIYDVAIIGAGVVGAALARELAQYDLRCVLIEAGDDVGAGTSKANTAILHTGFDAKAGLSGNAPGSARLSTAQGLQRANRDSGRAAWRDFGRLGRRSASGASGDSRNSAPQRLARCRDHFGRGTVSPGAELGAGALGALIVPRESIICPFTVPIAYATQAVINGVTSASEHPSSAHRADSRGQLFACTAPHETITCRYLVNAAGLHADTINRMLGYDEFGVIPRRGQLLVFDKMARGLVNHILLPMPSKMGKGVLISPTVFGNIMLGPTAENLNDKSATETTADGITMLLDKGKRILPDLLDEEVTAMYAGLRASTQHDDYQIYLHERARYLCLGGIRSTGLSASLAIAEYAVERLAEAGLESEAQSSEFQTVTMPNLGEAFPRPYQSDETDPAES